MGKVSCDLVDRFPRTRDDPRKEHEESQPLLIIVLCPLRLFVAD
jgi:hypothetical protein